MNLTYSRRATLIFLVLVAATCISLLLDTEKGRGYNISSVIVTIAFVKIWLVGNYFMELREAPVLLRLFFGGYVASVLAILLGFFYV
ncbi:MAG: cytochrome C oxidase subunit IV family protein [Mycobacterium sp.]